MTTLAIEQPETYEIHSARLNHLQALEAESISILREAVAEFARPVMLYSIGKDSSVMLRLAQKAFYPGKIPFPLLHVDASYKFPEMIRDRRAPRHALLHRQGLVGHAAPGAEGLLPRQDTFPASPCRYQLQIPGDDPIPRRVHPRNRRGPHRPPQRIRPRCRRQPLHPRHAELLRPPQNPQPARRPRSED